MKYFHYSNYQINSYIKITTKTGEWVEYFGGVVLMDSKAQVETWAS
jgi:hypothetical protein